MAHKPYDQYRYTKAWDSVEESINFLEKIEEIYMENYKYKIVGYILKELDEHGALKIEKKDHMTYDPIDFAEEEKMEKARQEYFKAFKEKHGTDVSYDRYKGTKIANIVNQAIDKLIKNGDMKSFSTEDIIMSEICGYLEDNGLVDFTDMPKEAVSELTETR